MALPFDILWIGIFKYMQQAWVKLSPIYSWTRCEEEQRKEISLVGDLAFPALWRTDLSAFFKPTLLRTTGGREAN